MTKTSNVSIADFWNSSFVVLFHQQQGCGRPSDGRLELEETRRRLRRAGRGRATDPRTPCPWRSPTELIWPPRPAQLDTSTKTIFSLSRQHNRDLARPLPTPLHQPTPLSPAFPTAPLATFPPSLLNQNPTIWLTLGISLWQKKQLRPTFLQLLRLYLFILYRVPSFSRFLFRNHKKTQ